MYSKIVIGLDQSYARTGYSVCIDGVVKAASFVRFDKAKNNTEKRFAVRAKLIDIYVALLKKGYSQGNDDKFMIVVERIRQFSKNFISMPYITSTAAMIGLIVDWSYTHQIPVYSVDTRCWKSRVLGSSTSAGEQGNKSSSVKHAIKLGFESKVVTVKTLKNGKQIIKYNDDVADAICISEFPFLNSDKKLLKLETL